MSKKKDWDREMRLRGDFDLIESLGQAAAECGARTAQGNKSAGWELALAAAERELKVRLGLRLTGGRRVTMRDVADQLARVSHAIQSLQMDVGLWGQK